MEFNELKDKDFDLKHNLYLRSIGEAASAYNPTDPEDSDGVPILARPKVSQTDPNLKIAHDNFSLIMNTKAGYLASNITREYGEDIPESVIEQYNEFDRLNNTQTLLKRMMSSCTGWGDTFSLCFLDEDKKVRMREVSSWVATVEYEPTTGDPRQGFIKKDKDTIVVYDKLSVSEYKRDGDQWKLIESNPHGFKEIPLIQWKNNDQCRGNSQKAVSLMDAYDTCVSDNATEVSVFRNAYLILKNMGKIDNEQKEAIKKTGVIAIGGDGEAKFLTKDVNPAFAELVINNLWSGIFTVSSSVDPRALSSLSGATAFQIGQIYRLMENDCQQTECDWQVSLQLLDNCLKSYWTAFATPQLPEYDTFDINYVFKRSLPQDILSDLEQLKRAGGQLPQWKLFARALNIPEEEARSLAEESSEELSVNLGVGIGE